MARAKAKTKKKAAPKKKPAPKKQTPLVKAQLAKVRELVGSLEGATETLSHGHPTFWVKKKCFAYFLDNHHDDGRLALWCMAPPGAQAMLVDSNSDHYFVPPYVGHMGWVGVRLDLDNEWAQIASILEGAYEARKAKR
jgi:hypothetical protein